MDICTKIIKNNNKIKIYIGCEINNGTHERRKRKTHFDLKLFIIY